MKRKDFSSMVNNHGNSFSLFFFSFILFLIHSPNAFCLTSTPICILPKTPNSTDFSQKKDRNWRWRWILSEERREQEVLYPHRWRGMSFTSSIQIFVIISLINEHFNNREKRRKLLILIMELLSESMIQTFVTCSSRFWEETTWELTWITLMCAKRAMSSSL